jgi:ESCRT-I complex subunit TSG101
MADVPDKVLAWLYNVLGTVSSLLSSSLALTGQDYVDASRTYSDVVETLSKFPSLSPRTEVYSSSTSPPHGAR